MPYIKIFGPDNTIIKQEVHCDERILNFAVIRNMILDLNIDINDADSIETFNTYDIDLGWKDEPVHSKCIDFVYDICKFIKDNDITPENYKEFMQLTSNNNNNSTITEFLTKLFKSYTGSNNHEEYRTFYYDILNLCNKYDADAQYENSSIILEILCCHFAYTYFYNKYDEYDEYA
jgi:hypothetical protein